MGNLIEALVENGYACAICYATENGINSIYSNPSSMCATHYQEWSDEKNVGEDWS